MISREAKLRLERNVMARRAGVSADALRERDAFLSAPPDWRLNEFRDAEVVSHAVERIIGKLAMPELEPADLRLARDWVKIVGPELARHAAPGRLEGGVLTVFATGGSWYAELRRTANARLLPRIRAALDPIRVSSLRVLPAPALAAR